MSPGRSGYGNGEVTSRTWFPLSRWARSRTVNARSSPPTPSTSRSSWSARTCEIVRADAGGARLKWALVKGRGNYVSIRRARLAQPSLRSSLFPEDRTRGDHKLDPGVDRVHLRRVALSDLPFSPSAETCGTRSGATTDACLRAQAAPHFQECFYQRCPAPGGKSADIVDRRITHLFFSDLAVRRARPSNCTRFGRIAGVRPGDASTRPITVEDAATPHLGVRDHPDRRLFRDPVATGQGREAACWLRSSRGLSGGASGHRPRPCKRTDRGQGEAPGSRPVARSELEGLFFDHLEPYAPSEERSGGVQSAAGGRPRGLEPAEHHGVSENAFAGPSLVRLSEFEAGPVRCFGTGWSSRRMTWQASLEGRLLDLRSSEESTRVAAWVHALRLVLSCPSEDDLGASYGGWRSHRSARRRLRNCA